MINLKNLITILFCLAILSCTSTKKTNGTDPKKITGIWTESWVSIIDDTNDVDYLDTLKIDIDSQKNIVIKCINRKNYKYSNIILRNDSLQFQMQNLNTDNFYLYYKLKITSKDSLSGKANIPNNKEAIIKLARVK
ncbi:hypothetical protein [Flavobacterium pedocola]